MQRRRRATREELIELLAGRAPDVDWPAALDALNDLGVEVDEEVPWPTSS